MRIAVLVKQIPKFEEMELGADGRLRRDGIELELNPYCRRAVSQGRRARVGARGRDVTVITLGPPAAEDTLREAIAWGRDRDVDIDGVLVTDPAFAGSDTLATAKALAAALAREGPFDLVLTGRNSVDADTGQVGPSSRSCSTCPFLTGVRHLSIDGDRVAARCEHDDGWLQAEVRLPGDPVVRRTPHRSGQGRSARTRRGARGDRIRRLAADRPRCRAVGAGRVTDVGRAGEGDGGRSRAAARGPTRRSPSRCDAAVRFLHRRAARSTPTATIEPGATVPDVAAALAVHRGRRSSPTARTATRELLGAAARLTGNVLAITLQRPEDGRRATEQLVGRRRDRAPRRRERRRGRRRAPSPSSRGASRRGRSSPVDRVGPRGRVARRGAARRRAHRRRGRARTRRRPARRVEARVRRSARRRDPLHVPGADGDGPRRRAARRSRRAPRRRDRDRDDRALEPRGRVRVLARTRDDDLDVLAEAHTVIGVGKGVAARRVRRARTAARRCSTPSSARPARSPTRVGSRAPARSASPAGRSRRACSSASARAASSTTPSACAPRARCSRSTPTRRADLRRAPTSASSATGARCSRCSSSSSRRATPSAVGRGPSRARAGART